MHEKSILFKNTLKLSQYFWLRYITEKVVRARVSLVYIAYFYFLYAFKKRQFAGDRFKFQFSTSYSKSYSTRCIYNIYSKTTKRVIAR